jgi:hypothetical protein
MIRSQKCVGMNLKMLPVTSMNLVKTVNNMDKIEKIRQKIDRMLDDICDADGYVQKKDEPRYDALAEVFDFIETLEEEPDESLEEAARLYAIPHYMEDIDVNHIEEYPYDTGLEAAFIAGAQWQEKRDEEIIKTAEDHAFLAGAEWQKEQMLKDAVEGEIHLVGFNNAIFIKEPRAEILDRYNVGDKVRIIVKED